MKKISEIVKEFKIKFWKEPYYLVIDANKDKAVITNLAGIILIAKNKGILVNLMDTSNPDEIEHDLKNELETDGIYVEHLQLHGDYTYQEITLVETITQFLGE